MTSKASYIPAPIALFVYNRPLHTRQTVEALQKNALAQDSDLFVFSDAAKTANASKAVGEVREYLKLITGFNSVTIVERQKNLGLANSIADGVTRLCEQFGRIIVLEDDLVTSPHFLRYVNEALDKYAGQPDVYSISGYSFTNDIPGVDSSYFLALTSSWGWATWADKWKIFKRDREALAEKLKASDFRERFNYKNSYDYSQLAEKQLEGKTDSWAIYWYFCVFQRNGLTLYPGKSLVQNIGLDGSGTHSGEGVNESSLTSFTPELTNDVFEKKELKKAVQTILRGGYRKSTLMSRLRTLGTRFSSK